MKDFFTLFAIGCAAICQTVCAQTIDPVKLSMATEAKQVALNEEFELKITAQYLSVSPQTAFVLDGANSFQLKVVTPRGFIQTGGTFVNQVTGNVTPSNPSISYILKGKFVDSSVDAKFILLRGGVKTDDRGIFYAASTLSFSVFSKTENFAAKTQENMVLTQQDSASYAPYLTSQDLREGKARLAKVVLVVDNGEVANFVYDSTSTAVDDSATVIRDGDRRYVLSSDIITPERFGAKGDAVDVEPTTVSATDDTHAFQRAINYLLNRGGGILTLRKSYLINGTVYIKPTTQAPITITGLIKTVKGKGSRISYPSIVRNVSGDIFRVNLDENGRSAYDPADQYGGFAINGISCLGKRQTSSGGDTPGIVLVRAFRTRGSYSNLYCSRIDYAVLQPDTDADNNDSYCDQSLYSNIRIVNSTYGGLKLYRTDNSLIDGFYFEDPNSTAKYGLEIKYGTTTNVRDILHWCPTTGSGGIGGGATLSGSAFIQLTACYSMKFSGLHLERLKFETGILVSNSLTSSFSEIHNRFSSNDMFKFVDCKAISVSNWHYWGTLSSSKYDVVYSGINKDVYFDKLVFETYPDHTDRNMAVSGGAGIITDTPLAKTTGTYVVADGLANYVLNSVGATVQLNTPTANRTLTLPPASSGKFITIVNRSNSPSFSWSTNPAIKMPDGSDQLQLPNNYSGILEFDGNVWRVIAGSSQTLMRKAVSDMNYTVLAGDHLICYTSLTAQRSVTLPDPTLYLGKEFIIKDESGNAGNQNITVVSAGTSKSIDGSPQKSINVAFGVLRVYSNGNNYFTK